MGDRSENGAYKAARARLSSIDSNLRRLTAVLRQAKIVAPPPPGVVGISSVVQIKNATGDTIQYTIVGGYESDLSTGRLSHLSPVGKALMGHRQGDRVSIRVPAGIQEFVIESIA